MLLKMLNQQNGVKVRTLDAEEKPVAEEAPKKEQEVVKPKRCQHDGCKVKLMLADFACRCKSFYCSQHRASEVHKCSYDYKTSGKDLLTKQMPAVIAEKFERV